MPTRNTSQSGTDCRVSVEEYGEYVRKALNAQCPWNKLDDKELGEVATAISKLPGFSASCLCCNDDDDPFQSS